MDRRRTIIYATLIALLGVLVFTPALGGGWIFDDHTLVEHNLYIHSFHDWPRWFLTDFWNVDDDLTRFESALHYWRPAISAGYAVDWQLGGGSPVIFHVTNLLAHGGACVLAFFTLRRWLGALVPAACAAALFVVHPTKAESVAWIAGRTDIICLLAVLLASTGVSRRLSGRHGGIALEVGGTVLAYLSKEQAIVLPCFVAIETWVALGRPALDRRTLVKLVRGALPQLAIAITYLGVRAALMPVRGAEGVVHIPVWQHALAVAETMGRFMSLAVAPHDLSIQEGLVHSIRGEYVHGWGYIALGTISTLLFVAIAIRYRLRRPGAALGIAFYLATIAPTSNLAYTGMQTLVSERFLYLPLLGLVFAAGDLIAVAAARWGRRVYAVVAAIVLAFAILTLRRAADFRDEASFWDRELAMHPDSQMARFQILGRDLESEHLYAALSILQRGPHYDSSVKEHLALAYQVAAVLARLIPDHDIVDLQTIDAFCEDVLAKRPAHLDMLEVKFTLDIAHIANDQALVRARPSFLALRADLQSRMGHDAIATTIAGQAIEECPRCGKVIAISALILARADRYEDALALLDAAVGSVSEATQAPARAHVEEARVLVEQSQQLQGPPALQARASALAKLEAWGRAFDVLAPYEHQIAEAPKFAVGFAELAFRAGEESTARRVLSVSRTPADIDALITEWTAKMGWTR